jgi:antitoxin component YwqK of YwqJK toxin-antitoxin module
MSLRIDIDDIDERCDDMVFYQGRPFTGVLYELYPDGTLHYEGEHVGGFPSGYLREWWPNGNKQLEVIYANSKNPNGKTTKWYENGSIEEFTEGSKADGTFHKKKWGVNGILIEGY